MDSHMEEIWLNVSVRNIYFFILYLLITYITNIVNKLDFKGSELLRHSNYKDAYIWLIAYMHYE